MIFKPALTILNLWQRFPTYVLFHLGSMQLGIIEFESKEYGDKILYNASRVSTSKALMHDPPYSFSSQLEANQYISLERYSEAGGEEMKITWRKTTCVLGNLFWILYKGDINLSCIKPFTVGRVVFYRS